MTAVQLDFAVEVRTRILERVLANGTDEWRENALRAVARAAATGRVFQAVDLLDFGATEPDHPNRWGGLLATSARIGLIEHVGYAASQRGSVQGSATKTWRGKDARPTADRVVELRALSIHRPYAALILAGIKPIENRTWDTRYRGLMVIHAAKHRATLPKEQLALLTTPYQVTVGMLPDLQYTGFVGVVELMDVCEEAVYGRACDCGPWALPNSRHWILANPRPFHTTLKANGRQRLFIPPLVVEDMARRAHAHPEAIS